MTPSAGNKHVSKEIAEKWPQYEFVGTPIKLRDGKTYIHAFHKVLEGTHYYCFEDDFFWFDKPEFK